MKKSYMARLERWARWMLPPQEADDVLADYREIAGAPPRPDDELLQDLGKPRDVIRPLVERESYRTWLAAFVGLAACVLFTGHSGFGVFSWPLYRLCFEQGLLHLGPVFALLGMVLALVWFRRGRDEPKTPIPKGIIITLAVLLVWIGLIFLFYWAILYHLEGFLAMWGMAQVWPGSLGVMAPRSVIFSKLAMTLLPHFVSYAALYWLVKARVHDRRWAAAYILTLTAIVISMETLAQTQSMVVTAPFEVGMRANLLKCAVFTVIGLAGAGAALYRLPQGRERQKKPLTKKGYMARLERWARWMLPQQEADDIIADYREITADEKLLQGLGRPRSVVRPLADSKSYHIWMAVFTVMAVCILAPGISGTFIGAPLWLYLFDGLTTRPYGAWLAILGAVAALVWFRWKGRKTGRLPRAIPILLAVFLACICWVLWFCWACSRDFDAFLEMWGQVRVWIGPNAGSPTPASFYLSRIAMGYVAAVIAVIGVFALVRARMGDRRWAAVSVLAVAAMLTALLVLDWSGRISYDSGVEAEFREMLTRCYVIAAVGLAGTGVALC